MDVIISPATDAWGRCGPRRLAETISPELKSLADQTFDTGDVGTFVPTTPAERREALAHIAVMRSYAKTRGLLVTHHERETGIVFRMYRPTKRKRSDD